MSEKLEDIRGQRPKTSRWVKGILVVSLGANLLVIGLVFGAYWRFSRADHVDFRAPETRMMLDLGLGPFLSAFEPEQRREIGNALRHEIGNPAKGREALAGELAVLLEVLRASPFDQNAFEDVLDSQRIRLSTRTIAGREALLEAVIAMPDDARAQFADRLERSLRRAVRNVHAIGRP